MVAWEVVIGRIKSICDNNEPKFGVSLWRLAEQELNKLSGNS
jgi:hypothetical protein